MGGYIFYDNLTLSTLVYKSSRAIIRNSVCFNKEMRTRKEIENEVQDHSEDEGRYIDLATAWHIRTLIEVLLDCRDILQKVPQIGEPLKGNQAKVEE